MTVKQKILVLNVGDGAGINFCNSLKLCEGKYHIIGADTNIFRLEYATADERFIFPEIEVDKEGFWRSLLRLISEKKPDFIYAADTGPELEILSERRAEIEIPFFLPPKDAVHVYEDKWLSYQYFKSAGITVPETVLVKSESDIDGAIEKFGSIWLRATKGSGGRGALPTNNPAMAKAWLDRHEGWGQFTAAEVLTKRMATWIGLWKDGELIVCQGRNRLHWEYGSLSPAGVTGITGAQSTSSDKIVHDVSLAAIKAVPYKPNGIVSVDVTYDKNGIPNPTEIQASRFYSSIFFLAKAGLNLPDLYVQTGITGKVPMLDKREHPLPDDLVWLKAVDCMPQLTTFEELARKEKIYRSAFDGKVGCDGPK